MKKIFKYVTLVLAVVIVVAIACIMVIRHNPGKNTEAFSDVRAYRTEVSPDTEIYDDNVAGDPFAYPLREELRNKSAEAFGIINAARQEQGLKPLAWDSALEYASHVRVNEIAVMFDKNHLRPNGTYWFTVEPSIILGENIYKGYGDAQKAMESWLSNSTDNENFFNADFDKMTIAVYEDERGEYFWVALFSADN